MNRDKSEAMHIGVSSNFRHKIAYIRWANDFIKCLGVHILKDPMKATDHSIKGKLDNIENIIKIWQCRNVTP